MPDAPALGAPTDVRVRGALNANALRVLRTEGKIPAIKFVRQKTGFGLKQAKDYVEAVEAGRDPGPIEATRSKSGCGPAAAIAVVLAMVAVLLRVLLMHGGGLP